MGGRALAEIVDVAVVGAGAAGIAAARRLRDAGRSVLLVEALSRLGGRARTEVVAGMPLDLGCGWLHSAERNPLAALAAAEGLELDRRDAAWGRQLEGLGAPDEVRTQAWQAYEAFGRQLRTDPPESDRAGDAMAADDRWRPFVDALSGFMNGTATDRLSVRDFLAYDDAASELNWRLPGGYGRFIAGLADGLPAALGTRATAVSEGRTVRVDTDRGPIEARAAIVAVSTAILAAGTIRFDAGVDAHLEAAGRLPLGLADKVFLSIADTEVLPPESHLLGRFDSACTASYYLRPFGRPVIECFLGGTLARGLETEGKGAATAFVTAELGALLGARFARGLAPLVVTAWGREPTILGAYSHAEPGAADARAVLAAPVSPRLVFAGEACSPHDFSTAHGAWQSGLAAADWIERGLS
ncbi:MAG: FAD-dependent oxidoreductase [Amaricoccus sp.]